MQYKVVSFGQIMLRSLQEGGGWAIVGVGLSFILMLVLVLLRARVTCLVVLFYALSFSLFAGAFGTIFTGIRWLVLLAMVPLAIHGLRGLGMGVYAMWAYGALGLLFCFRAPSISYAMEKGIGHALMLVAVPGVIKVALDKGMKAQTLFKALALLAGIWTGVNVLSLRAHLAGHASERFQGEAVSPGYFALVQGLLLPFLIWGVFMAWSAVWRTLCIVGSGLLSVLLVFGATRGGPFMAVIIAIPLVLRASLRRVMVGALVILVTVAAIYFTLSFAGAAQKQFVAQRYSGSGGSAALTGRVALWQKSLRAALESPVFGHGTSSSTIYGLRELGRSSAHNAYLIVWYEAGIFGLLAFILSLWVNVVRSFRIIRRSKDDPEMNLLGRLCLGITLGLAAISFFEANLAGATNVVIGIYLMATVLIHWAWQQVSAFDGFTEAELLDLDDPYAAPYGPPAVAGWSGVGGAHLRTREDAARV